MITTPRAAARGPWTYERLCAETPVDNVRREIIDGWLYIDGQQVDDPMAEVVAESAAVSTVTPSVSCRSRCCRSW